MQCNSELLRDILAKRLETIRRFVLCCSYAEVSMVKRLEKSRAKHKFNRLSLNFS